MQCAYLSIHPSILPIHPSNAGKIRLSPISSHHHQPAPSQTTPPPPVSPSISPPLPSPTNLEFQHHITIPQIPPSSTFAPTFSHQPNVSQLGPFAALTSSPKALWSFLFPLSLACARSTHLHRTHHRHSTTLDPCVSDQPPPLFSLLNVCPCVSLSSSNRLPSPVISA